MLYVLKNDLDNVLKLTSAFINYEASLDDLVRPDIYPYVKNQFILTVSEKPNKDLLINEYRINYEKRKILVDSSLKTQFARSAYYMGSKVKLRHFILECLGLLPLSKITLVDLMTGSGTVAGVFSNLTKTISSDAMKFPKYLSIVQGGGYKKEDAKKVIINIKAQYIKHYNDIKSDYLHLMNIEDEYLKADDREQVAINYSELLYNHDYLSNLDDKMNIRKNNPRTYPYILITECYANVFFGVNQAVQIDSLRYAIDMLENETDREWALGALISTCSRIASSHASHFEQPTVIVDTKNNFKYKNIQKMLNRRKISVWREFEATLLSLAKESEKSMHPVLFYDGPWMKSLQTARETLGKDVVVYVDAPYKREEYSRYYHVLETLVNYDYPDLTTKGKMPPKSRTKGCNENRQRFYSEFFTKTNTQIEKIFVNIFINILKEGWHCAWSYSNNGMASVVNVVNSVANELPCNINLYSTPYLHKHQNINQKPLDVSEYLILFSPIS